MLRRKGAGAGLRPAMPLGSAASLPSERVCLRREGVLCTHTGWGKSLQGPLTGTGPGRRGAQERVGCRCVWARLLHRRPGSSRGPGSPGRYCWALVSLTSAEQPKQNPQISTLTRL